VGTKKDDPCRIQESSFKEIVALIGVYFIGYISLTGSLLYFL